MAYVVTETKTPDRGHRKTGEPRWGARFLTWIGDQLMHGTTGDQTVTWRFPPF